MKRTLAWLVLTSWLAAFIGGTSLVFTPIEFVVWWAAMAVVLACVAGFMWSVLWALGVVLGPTK